MSRTINDVIDELGFGGAQIRLVVFGGGIYLLDGITVNICATLPATIAGELGLDPYQRALLLSSLLFGKLVGNFTNIVNDAWLNRRVPILFGYVLTIACGLAITFMYSGRLLSATWALAGFGMGLGCPAWNALGTEGSPANKRMLTGGLSHVWFSVGAITTLSVELYHSRNLELGPYWRTFALWLMVPPALLFLGALLIGFVDSAHGFFVQGKLDKARNVLATMRSQNGRADVSIEFDQPGHRPTIPGLWSGISALFSRQLYLLTFISCLCCFVLNFVSYGTGYALPIVLPTLNLQVPPAVVLCALAVLDVLGYCLAILCSKVISRRFQIVMYLTGVIILNVILCFGLHLLKSPNPGFAGQAATLTGILAMPLVLSQGWLVVYVYTTEVFPTSCRSFAHGFCLGVGRLGSISAPFAFEHLQVLTSTHTTFFGTLCTMAMINGALVLLVLPETKGVPLEENLSDASAKGEKTSLLPRDGMRRELA